MKKLIEVSLKSIIFFIGWAICASVIPIPDIDNAALWRFFAELIPFLAIVVMSVIFWFVDRKKTKLHLTQRPVYSSVLGVTVGLSWLGISVGILLFTGSARIEGTIIFLCSGSGYYQPLSTQLCRKCWFVVIYIR